MLNPNRIPVVLPTMEEVNGTNRDHFLVVVGWANWSTAVLWVGAAGLKAAHSRVWAPR